MRTIKQEHYFPVIVGIHFIFWWIDLALYTGDYEYTAQHIAGEVFSSWVVTVFAANFLMSTRAKWVEKMFGGLDKMYMIHRRSGVIAIILLLLHFIIIPKYPNFSIGKPLGFASLILILIGVILSAAPVFKRKFKYSKWMNFHKLMGVFYILGIAHSFKVETLTSELPIVRTYVYGMALVGIIAWFYKAFLYNILNKKLDYTVSSITKFDNDTVELNLTPNGAKLAFEAGQFTFLRLGDNSEFHPFTISNHPNSDNLRFTIKSLGDYTSDLQTSIKEGVTAKVQGAFGQFNFKNTKFQNQVWLAGGIGITPFLSFLQEVDSSFNVTLVWSVKSVEQGIYQKEIDAIVAKKPNVKFVLWDSQTKGHFAIESLFNTTTIKDHSIMICGAEVMREAYIKQLLEKGISITDIHYEEFAFR